MVHLSFMKTIIFSGLKSPNTLLQNNTFINLLNVLLLCYLCIQLLYQYVYFLFNFYLLLFHYSLFPSHFYLSICFPVDVMTVAAVCPSSI